MILRELLEKIIQTEDIASLVYERIAAVNKGDIATTALAFAKEETYHAQVIQSIIERSKGLENPVPEEVGILVELAQKEGGDPTIKLIGASRKQLFQHALQIEKNSITLYEDIVRYFAPHTTERQHFEKLAKEERAHMYFILKKLHELK